MRDDDQKRGSKLVLLGRDRDKEVSLERNLSCRMKKYFLTDSESVLWRKGGGGIPARGNNHSRHAEVGELIENLGNDGNLVSLKWKVAQ